MITTRCECGQTWTERDEKEHPERVCRVDHDKELLWYGLRAAAAIVGLWLIGCGIELGYRSGLWIELWRAL